MQPSPRAWNMAWPRATTGSRHCWKREYPRPATIITRPEEQLFHESVTPSSPRTSKHRRVPCGPAGEHHHLGGYRCRDGRGGCLSGIDRTRAIHDPPAAAGDHVSDPLWHRQQLFDRRLAPDRPMGHALALGAAGFIACLAGAVAMWGVGPNWYPVAPIVLALPSAWAGGQLRVRQLAQDDSPHSRADTHVQEGSRKGSEY